MRGRAQTEAATSTQFPGHNSQEGEEDALLDIPHSKSSPELNFEGFDNQTGSGTRTGFSLVLVLGFGFFLIFSAYNTSQDFATHLLGTSLGTLALALNVSAPYCCERVSKC